MSAIKPKGALLPFEGEGCGALTRGDPLNSFALVAAQVHPAVKLSHPQTPKKLEVAGPGSASSFEPRGARQPVSAAPG